jgi:hypothetical protein
MVIETGAIIVFLETWIGNQILCVTIAKKNADDCDDMWKNFFHAKNTTPS